MGYCNIGNKSPSCLGLGLLFLPHNICGNTFYAGLLILYIESVCHVESLVVVSISYVLEIELRV